MLQPQVFVSIGSPRTEDQRAFKLALLETLRSQGLSPRTVGRNPEDTDAAYAHPFDQICRIVSESHGAVVVAYQKHLARDFEFDCLSPRNQRRFAEMKLATAWNQAEAAIAYEARVPLLLICEEGVHREAIFDDEAITSPIALKIEPKALGDVVFQRTLLSWITDVRKHADGEKKPAEEPVDLTLRQIVRSLGGLSLHDAVVLYGLAIGLLGGAAALGCWLRDVVPFFHH